LEIEILFIVVKESRNYVFQEDIPAPTTPVVRVISYDLEGAYKVFNAVTPSPLQTMGFPEIHRIKNFETVCLLKIVHFEVFTQNNEAFGAHTNQQSLGTRVFSYAAGYLSYFWKGWFFNFRRGSFGWKLDILVAF